MGMTRRTSPETFVLWLAVVAAACGSDGGVEPDAGTGSGIDAAVADAAPMDAPSPPSRYYGNVPIGLDLKDVTTYAAHHIGDDSNLLALHIDALGIPWIEFGTGAELPAEWLAKLEEVEEMVASIGAPVYLPLTPLWIDRARLTADASAPFVPVGGPCLAELADWDVRRDGYKAYVEYMVQRFNPVFVALSIEVNSYVENCPGAWPEVRSLLNEVYAAQKTLRPDLPVFNTFTINQLWKATSACHGFVETCIDAGLAAIGDLSGDLFAISTYPLIVYRVNGDNLPSNWLSIFAEKTGKPVAIAETGWQAYSIDTRDPDQPEQCVTIPSSAEDQDWWMQRILADAESLDMPFVVWWANHDYIPAAVSQSCTCDDPEEPWCEFVNRAKNEADPTAFGLRFFAMMGLRDYDGAPRLSHASWVAAVAAARLP
jgi:hypothetical protein